MNSCLVRTDLCSQADDKRDGDIFVTRTASIYKANSESGNSWTELVLCLGGKGDDKRMNIEINGEQ